MGGREGGGREGEGRRVRDRDGSMMEGERAAGSEGMCACVCVRVCDRGHAAYIMYCVCCVCLCCVCALCVHVYVHTLAHCWGK